jgi:hypothetical protein
MESDTSTVDRCAAPPGVIMLFWCPDLNRHAAATDKGLDIPVVSCWGLLVTRMDTSVALPLCALSACRSARMQSLIRVLAIAGLIVAGSMSGAKATADGLKAFQGAPGETHKSADFTPAAKSLPAVQRPV